MSCDLPVDFVTQAPLIGTEKVLQLLNTNFGIKPTSVLLLSGYDDLNWLLEDVIYSENDDEKASKYGRKLVCKFTNPLETRHSGLLDSQVKFLFYLKSNGIPCASLLPSLKGNFYEYVDMNEDVRLPIRVFTFLPGQTMEKIGYSDDEIFFKIGNLTAKFHELTTNYSDDKWFKMNLIPISLEMWQYLENEFEIQCGIGTIKSENITLCQEVFQKFNNNVLQNRQQFEEGIIHSDINETNVLLEKNGTKFKITGLIDFGDTHYSLRIFDIAASILYILMDAPTTDPKKQWPSIIKRYLQGYRSIREVRDLQVCQLSMCARLTASLIYGLRTVRINARGDDPSYILKTQQKGWQILHLLADTKLRLFDDEEEQQQR